MGIIENSIETTRQGLSPDLREILIGTKPISVPEGATEASVKFWGRDLGKDKR